MLWDKSTVESSELLHSAPGEKYPVYMQWLIQTQRSLEYCQNTSREKLRSRCRCCGKPKRWITDTFRIRKSDRSPRHSFVPYRSDQDCYKYQHDGHPRVFTPEALLQLQSTAHFNFRDSPERPNIFQGSTKRWHLRTSPRRSKSLSPYLPK